jgi:hypothetical protein
MTKIAGSGFESGSISQRHGSADPDQDPPQNVMDPQHWLFVRSGMETKTGSGINISDPQSLLLALGTGTYGTTAHKQLYHFRLVPENYNLFKKISSLG